MLQSEFFQFRELTTFGGDHFTGIAELLRRLSTSGMAGFMVKQLTANRF